MDTKAKIFALERPRQDSSQAVVSEAEGLEIARLLGKLDRIEKDVLFDKYPADQQWKVKRIQLEKDYSATRKQKAAEAEKAEQKESQAEDINAEAERIAAEILAEKDDDDFAVADLFASLPTTEIDAVTGKSNTVINGTDGSKTLIRDFGKWTGVGPVRALEEACRAR